MSRVDDEDGGTGAATTDQVANLALAFVQQNGQLKRPIRGSADKQSCEFCGENILRQKVEIFRSDYHMDPVCCPRCEIEQNEKNERRRIEFFRGRRFIG